MMSKKLSFELVKQVFEEYGYTLVSNFYVNSKTKLKTICPNNHIYMTTYTNFKHRGRRCNKCYFKRLGDLKRLDFNYVKASFESEGYTLLTTTYNNVDQKLDFICPNNHRHSISFHNWYSGWRCVKCRDLRHSIICSGDNHPLWRGGISNDSYCDAWADKEYKKDIMSRDNNICQNPYCYKHDRVLAIHHIDYDKKNCHPSNLITVCRSCNAMANKDRSWHNEWYKIINKNRGF